MLKVRGGGGENICSIESASKRLNRPVPKEVVVPGDVILFYYHLKTSSDKSVLISKSLEHLFLISLLAESSVSKLTPSGRGFT